MKDWANFHQQIEWARTQLTTALMGDILDEMGFPNQFLPKYLRAADPNMVLVGKVMTVRGEDVTDTSHLEKDPYGRLFEALDSLQKNEVFVYAGGSPEYAIWGGLMSTRAIQLEAAGALIDGCYRDTQEILDLNFPTFGRHAYGPDQKSRGLIKDFRCPIKIGKVLIEDGDFIFGDRDGIVLVPQKITEEVLTKAHQKLQTENKIKLALLQGMSAQEAFDKFGIF